MDNNFNQFDNQGGFPQPNTSPTPPTPPDLATDVNMEMPAMNTAHEEIVLSSGNESSSLNNINGQSQGISQVNNVGQETAANLNNIDLVNQSNTVPVNQPNIGQTPQQNTGFVPNLPPENNNNIESKKKDKKPLIIGLASAIILIIIGVFVIFPIVQKKFMSNPKNVFDTTIKNASKNMNEFISDINLESFLFDINLKYDTNIESLKQFSGYTYGLKTGFNTKEQLMEASLYMKDSNNKNYGLDAYLKNQKTYMKLSNNDSLLYLGEEDKNEIASTFEELNNYLNNKISNDEISYLIDKVSSLMVDSIDEDRLTKEDGTLKINDDEIDVTKNIYNIDKSTLDKTKDFIINGLVEDKKTLKTLAKLLEVDEDKVKETLNGENDNIDTIDNNNQDVNIDVIIFTEKKKNDVVGYELQSDKKAIISYVFNDNGFSLVLDDSDDEVDGIEVKEDTKQIIKLIGTKENDKTNVDILYNDQKYINLVVSQFDDKAVKFTYKINAEDVNVNGDFALTMNNSNSGKEDKLVLSLNSGSDKININLNFTTKNNPKIADIDVNNAKELSDEELSKAMNDFIVSLSDTPIGYLLSTTNGLVDKDTYEQYGSLNK